MDLHPSATNYPREKKNGKKEEKYLGSMYQLKGKHEHTRTIHWDHPIPCSSREQDQCVDQPALLQLTHVLNVGCTGTVPFC